MLKRLINILRLLILMLPIGMIIDASSVQKKMGVEYEIGDKINSLFGKALAYLCRQGLLQFVGKRYTYGLSKTTMSVYRIL